nr:lasso peptide biosynthesis B2 protein [Paenibacillus dendritiformis]
MKTRSLKDILIDLDAYRRRKVPSPMSQSPTLTEDIVRAAHGFRLARRYVPIEPLCLLDSLALLKFLAKRGLHADLIFGVTSDPFSAHCWLQSGGLVLNDTVGNANSHTPMRVI